MELELVGNCGCEFEQSSCNECYCLIWAAVILILILTIAFLCYKAFSKYLDTKKNMADEELKRKKEEFEAKMEWEKYLDKNLTDRKKEDLELRIREFKEITYPSKILEKIDNKEMVTEEFMSIIKELMNKVTKIEE